MSIATKSIKRNKQLHGHCVLMEIYSGIAVSLQQHGFLVNKTCDLGRCFSSL